MIHAEYVEFDQPTGARVRRLEVFGHAGYAPRGQDIVRSEEHTSVLQSLR